MVLTMIVLKYTILADGVYKLSFLIENKRTQSQFIKVLFVIE